jgi:hypothetical protein
MSDLRPGDRVELLRRTDCYRFVSSDRGMIVYILAEEWDGYADVRFTSGDRAYVDIRDLRRVEATP